MIRTHTCPQATANVPFVLSKITVSNGTDRYGDPATAMCTTIFRQTCVANATTCCKMDLAKVEVLMNPMCKADVRRITVNGKDMKYSWAFYDRFIALKFVRLTRVIPRPNGAKLCWYVSRPACSVPSTFCYKNRCQANIFNGDNSCCPANLIS
ncbi:hypothetical protein PLESTF_001772300 [Pleodorina starrii]|nr:hypothetical protein PLESTM_000979700 [Pleodorina starrii]GLC76372.1 hypothetical protein PLESTF_001772300 [Pleodorina starrii]